MEVKKEKNKNRQVRTFTVPISLGEIRRNINLTTNTPSKEQIIREAFKLDSQGNISEASKYYQYFINQGFEDYRVFLNYGAMLIKLGKLKEAEILTKKAIKLKPDCAIGHTNLGFIFLRNENYKLSLKYYSEGAKLNCLAREGENIESDNLRFKSISKYKIKHDIEQFEYLASQGYETKKFTSLATLYKKIADEINWPSETEIIKLSNRYHSTLKGNYNRLIHQIESTRLKEEAVNNSLDIERITSDYFDHEYGLTYIDNFLSPKAIKSLRDFLLGSTIWFNILYKGGYLGTNLKEGLANPLIFQIAEELKNKFPKIFKNHAIKQIWAYKYDSQAKKTGSKLSGIHPHADEGKITFNFWITPDQANLNPSSGGLVIHSLEAPNEWNYDYQNSHKHDLDHIQNELKRSKGPTEIIPYKENRAVIFNSRLFHETDNYEFKDGYQNRRINFAILFK